MRGASGRWRMRRAGAANPSLTVGAQTVGARNIAALSCSHGPPTTWKRADPVAVSSNSQRRPRLPRARLSTTKVRARRPVVSSITLPAPSSTAWSSTQSVIASAEFRFRCTLPGVVTST